MGSRGLAGKAWTSWVAASKLPKKLTNECAEISLRASHIIWTQKDTQWHDPPLLRLDRHRCSNQQTVSTPNALTTASVTQWQGTLPCPSATTQLRSIPMPTANVLTTTSVTQWQRALPCPSTTTQLRSISMPLLPTNPPACPPCIPQATSIDGVGPGLGFGGGAP